MTIKTANQLVHAAARQMANQTVNEERAAPNLDQHTREIVNKIFSSIKGAYPSSFKHAFPDDETLAIAKTTWVKALMDSGISDMNAIKRGVAKARQRNSPFFPSCGEFIELCKAECSDLGMPSASEAWLEVCNNSHRVTDHQWSHPGVYEAGRRKWFEIRAGDYKKSDFVARYNEIMNQVAQGVVFDQPKTDSTRLEYSAQGDRTRTEETKAAAESALADLKKAFNL